MLKKIAKTAFERGYSTEIYHCGFDPNSLDMVIVRELDWAIFDSTAPHEYFPSRKNDVSIDLYKLTITPGTDEKYENEINDAQRRYKAEMKKGLDRLKAVKNLEDELNKIYNEATKVSSITSIREEINEQIIKWEMVR